MKNRFARTGPGKPFIGYFIGTQEYKHLKLSPHLAVARRKSLLQPSHVAQSPYRCSPPCAQLCLPGISCATTMTATVSCSSPAHSPDLAGDSSMETSAFPLYPRVGQGCVGVWPHLIVNAPKSGGPQGWRSQLYQGKSRVQRRKKI